jgi:hypothetical protein
VSEADPTRRTLLQGLVVVALGGDQVAGAASTSLSVADLDDLVAFTGVLAAGAELPAADRAHVLEHLQERQRAGGRSQIEAYRAAVRLLARLAGARFATLSIDRRVDVVRRHDLGRTVERPGDAGEAREVRARVVGDLIGGYYASPAGWAVVGYAAFPGRCGSLERYTRPVA